MNERKQQILESLNISNNFETKFKKKKKKISSNSPNFVEVYKEKFTNYMDEIKSKIDEATYGEVCYGINFTLNKLLLFFGEIISNIKTYENILTQQEETIRKLYKIIFKKNIENEDLQYDLIKLSKIIKKNTLIKEKSKVNVNNNILLTENKKENEILTLRAENLSLKKKIAKNEKEITLLKNNLNKEKYKLINKRNGYKMSMFQINKMKQDSSLMHIIPNNSKEIMDKASHTDHEFYQKNFSTKHLSMKRFIYPGNLISNQNKLLSSNNSDNYIKKNSKNNILISNNDTTVKIKNKKMKKKNTNTNTKCYSINSILSLNNNKIQYKTFLKKNNKKNLNNAALKNNNNIKKSKMPNVIYSRNNKKENNYSDCIIRNTSKPKNVTVAKNSSKGKKLFKMKNESSQEGMLQNNRPSKEELKYNLTTTENFTLKSNNEVIYINKNSVCNDMDIKKYIKKKLTKMKKKRGNAAHRAITSVFSQTSNEGNISSTLPLTNKNTIFKLK